MARLPLWSQTLGSAWPIVWSLAKIVAIVLPVLGLVAYLTLWERRLIGWFHIRIGPNRVGPLGLFQPIADGIKLLTKEIITPSQADRSLYFLAPVVILMPALAAWAVIPFGPGIVLADINAGLLFVMALHRRVRRHHRGLGIEFEYAFLGAMRAAAQMVSYEIGMGLLVTVLMVAGTLNMTQIVSAEHRHVRFDGAELSVMELAAVAATARDLCRRASPKRIAIRSTWSRANRRSSPVTWSSTRDELRDFLWPSTRT